MKMKKLLKTMLPVLLIIAIAATFAGCGGNRETDPDESLIVTTAPAEETAPAGETPKGEHLVMEPSEESPEATEEPATEEPEMTGTPAEEPATEAPATSTPAPSTATPKPSSPTAAPHTHSYTKTVTREASCKEEGLAAYKCSCGDTYTEANPATGHNWEFDIIHDDGEIRMEPTYKIATHVYIYVSYELEEAGIKAGFENDPERPGYHTVCLMEYYNEKGVLEFIRVYGQEAYEGKTGSNSDVANDLLVKAVMAYRYDLGLAYTTSNYRYNYVYVDEKVQSGTTEVWVNLPSDTPRWTCSHCGKVVLFQNEKPED